MNHEQNGTSDDLTDEQLALLPALVEGMDPDAYIVIPISVLSNQVTRSVEAIARRYRGELRPGAFAVHLMRSLQRVGVLVDTAHKGNGMNEAQR